MILGDFCQKFQKKKVSRNFAIFGPFWGAGGPYPGGKNVPLPSLHHFPLSKAQNGMKKKTFGTKYRVIFRVGGGSIAENSPTDGWPPIEGFQKPESHTKQQTYSATSVQHVLEPEVPSRGEAGFDVEDIVKILGEPTRSDLSEEKECDGRSRICLNRPQDPGKWGSLPALPATWSATWPAMQA